MKKVFFIFILLFFSLSLWAQEESPDGSAEPDESWEDEAPLPPPKKKNVMKNRGFELSLLNLDINFSNSFVAASDVIHSPSDMIETGKFFKDSVSINMNDFFRGFTFLFGAVIEPLSLNLNWKDKWGFGLDIGHINVTGNLLLSGNLLSFNEVSDDKFGVGAAVFADVGVPVFFHYNNIKIKIRPSAFLPLVYTEPNVTYSYSQSGDPDGIVGVKLQADYDIRVYSVVDMEGLFNNDMDAVLRNLQDNAWDIARNNLGYDISLGVEYPLYDYLDIGVDITNIPLVMANLNHYMRFQGNAFFDASKISIDDLINGKDLPKDAYDYPEDIKPVFDSDGSKKVYRPFTMLFYAKYRPFESQVFSLIPSLGFSLNPLYSQQLGSIEGGLSIRLDLANFFITTIGVNYNDRRWKNSIDFALNLRLFEIDFGVSFQSSDFVKSFQGAGLGVNVGLKLGL